MTGSLDCNGTLLELNSMPPARKARGGRPAKSAGIEAGGARVKANSVDSCEWTALVVNRSPHP
jgi:hypothetical protein